MRFTPSFGDLPQNLVRRYAETAVALGVLARVPANFVLDFWFGVPDQGLTGYTSTTTYDPNRS